MAEAAASAPGNSFISQGFGALKAISQRGDIYFAMGVSGIACPARFHAWPVDYDFGADPDDGIIR
jgi:hypothetical protein